MFGLRDGETGKKLREQHKEQVWTKHKANFVNETIFETAQRQEKNSTETVLLSPISVKVFDVGFENNPRSLNFTDLAHTLLLRLM